jgi:hypothetical protein
MSKGGAVPVDVDRVATLLSPQHRRVLERALERKDGANCILVHTLQPDASLPLHENLDSTVVIVAWGLLETLPSSESSSTFRSLVAGWLKSPARALQARMSALKLLTNSDIPASCENGGLPVRSASLSLQPTRSRSPLRGLSDL